MPRQNRVTPLSTLIADPARGLFMGNRGCLHRPDGTIARAHAGRRWITCLTEFRGRKRALMQPGRYTELFFLDEAVALTAGHRPCAECRRDDYRRFQAAWRTAGLPGATDADSMDLVLHATRLDPAAGAPARHQARTADLAEGAFVLASGEACLWLGGQLRPWRPGGYRSPLPGRPDATLPVLTPRPILAVLAAGYRPVIHPTAR